MNGQISLTAARAEWQSNARLRYGVYVVLATLWVYGVVVIKDFVKAEQVSWESIESQTARARATAAEADWPTRSEDVKAATADFETLLWRQGSIGLSQAAFQENIAQTFAAAGLVVRANRAATPAEVTTLPSLTSLLQLRSRAQIEFRPSTFYPWLATIARAKAERRSSVLIDSLVIRVGGPGQPATAEVELVGYAVKPSANTAEPTSGNVQPGQRP